MAEVVRPAERNKFQEWVANTPLGSDKAFKVADKITKTPSNVANTVKNIGLDNLSRAGLGLAMISFLDKFGDDRNEKENKPIEAEENKTENFGWR